MSMYNESLRAFLKPVLPHLDDPTVSEIMINGPTDIWIERKGKVSKIATFGAFVELDGDIDGLVHISQISEDRVEKIKDVLKVGQEIEARVIKLDKVERRIGLSIKAANYSDEDMKREAAAFETALKPGEDMVGLDQAFASAFEDYRPGQ